MAIKLDPEDEKYIHQLSRWLKERTYQLMDEHPFWSKEYAYMVAMMEAAGDGSGDA